MEMPRRTDAMRRLESARTATELTTSILGAALQLITVAAIVRRGLRTFTRKR